MVHADEYNIPDPVFKKLILTELGKTDGELIAEDFLVISKVRSLHLGGAIKSIEGIQNFKSLESLTLFEVYNIDLSPLRVLENINVVDISSNVIIDISPLSSFKKIYSLTISDMPIDNLSYFSELHNILGLFLINTKIKDFSPQPNMVDLKGLSILSDLDIDYKSIGKWNNLDVLAITSTNFNESGLYEYPTDNRYINLEPLDLSLFSKLVMLEALTIRHPKLINSEVMCKFKNVKYLTLSTLTKLDLKFIRGMNCLQRIDFNFPGISDLSLLSNLTNLTSIKIGKNNLMDISPLLTMKNLKNVSINLNSENEDILRDQIKALNKHGTKAKRGFPMSECTMVLLILANTQSSFQESNPNKNFGSWEEIVRFDLIKNKRFSRETLIYGYTIAVFDNSLCQKDDVGNVVKNSTFKIVAVPNDPSSDFDIFAIDESQVLKVWIGGEAEWDVNNIDLNNLDLWEPI